MTIEDDLRRSGQTIQTQHQTGDRLPGRRRLRQRTAGVDQLRPRHLPRPARATREHEHHTRRRREIFEPVGHSLSLHSDAVCSASTKGEVIR